MGLQSCKTSIPCFNGQQWLGLQKDDEALPCGPHLAHSLWPRIPFDSLRHPALPPCSSHSSLGWHIPSSELHFSANSRITSDCHYLEFHTTCNNLVPPHLMPTSTVTFKQWFFPRVLTAVHVPVPSWVLSAIRVYYLHLLQLYIASHSWSFSSS